MGCKEDRSISLANKMRVGYPYRGSEARWERGFLVEICFFFVRDGLETSILSVQSRENPGI